MSAPRKKRETAAEKKVRVDASNARLIATGKAQVMADAIADAVVAELTCGGIVGAAADMLAPLALRYLGYMNDALPEKGTEE